MGPEQKPGTFGIDDVRVSGGNRRDPNGRDADIAAAAIDFIKANKGGPFYANVWFHTAHNPVAPPKGFSDKFAGLTINRADFANPDTLAHFDRYKKFGGDPDAGMRNYLGDVLQLDGQVAKVLKALDDLGLRENTLVVFTSDNGPANCTGGDDEGGGKKDRLHENMLGTAGPFRDRKHSLYDGGIHMPLIARWPGHVKAGRVDRSAVLAGVDWLPTLAAVCGAKPPGAKPDGEDVSDVLLGAERARKTDLFWKASNPKDTPAMRRGPWKFHESRRVPAELYDVTKDPGERENVAARFPAVVKELSAALKRWNDALPQSYEKGDAKD
jgi:N-acetylgalactosamine-6-sulfatase